jgi:hypothetical protein
MKNEQKKQELSIKLGFVCGSLVLNTNDPTSVVENKKMAVAQTILFFIRY